MITRRLALFRIGASTAVATTAAVPALITSQPESREPFKHPAEYLSAMEAIGWRPIAMYKRDSEGGVSCMGVNERCDGPEHASRTWLQFHAISMRMPVQLPMDVHPGGWWGQVWQFLYEKGLRKKVEINAGSIHEDCV